MTKHEAVKVLPWRVLTDDGIDGTWRIHAEFASEFEANETALYMMHSYPGRWVVRQALGESN